MKLIKIQAIDTESEETARVFFESMNPDAFGIDTVCVLLSHNLDMRYMDKETLLKLRETVDEALKEGGE